MTAPITQAEPTAIPRGGVVVLQEAWGVTPYIESVVQQLADAGWRAVAPHMFWRTGDPVLNPADGTEQIAPHVQALTEETFLDDLDTAIEAIGLDSRHCAVIGFCMGGSNAFIAATRRDLGAAVTFYGGGITQPRYGRPALANVGVELRAPWLGLYGDTDPGITMSDVETLRISAAKAPVPTEIIRYAEAGHAFHNHDRPNMYVAKAAQDAWHRTLDWLDSYVEQP